MLKPAIQDAINDQINFEMFSGYIYLSMAAYFESTNLPGMAAWMRAQTLEEGAHALKMFDYINERGGRVELKPIDGPQKEWTSPLDAFETALHHEQVVTGRINDMVDLAREQRDQATYNFLQWYIDEQVEEEANVDAIVNQLKLVGDSGHGLLMIDRELGARTFVAPAAPAAGA